MKKLKYIAIAIAVVLFVSGGIYIGYRWNNTDSSYTLTHEMRKNIEENWQDDWYGEPLRWGKYATRFYGSHGDCLVVFTIQGARGYGYTEFQVGGITFFYTQSFSIHVFRDGEWLSLPESYDQGWLTWWQVRSIAEFHKETWGDLANPLK